MGENREYSKMALSLFFNFLKWLLKSLRKNFRKNHPQMTHSWFIWFCINYTIFGIISNNLIFDILYFRKNFHNPTINWYPVVNPLAQISMIFFCEFNDFDSSKIFSVVIFSFWIFLKLFLKIISSKFYFVLKF